jgi:DNA helicase-2/ATP-dependent DNA helicase PcrA
MLDRFEPTSEQAEVISSPLEPAVVIAGAGSGKTETMASRVLWLVANGFVEPHQILGLTFTRKAAGELQQRIRSRLRSLRRVIGGGNELAGEPTVLTYSSYAGRLVDEHAMLLGAEPGLRLLSEAARWQLADSVVRQYAGSFSIEPGVIATVTERMLGLSGQLADHLAEADAVRNHSSRLLEQLEPLPPKLRARRAWPELVEKFRHAATRRTELLPLIEQFDATKRRDAVIDFADQMVLGARLAVLPQVVAAERERFPVVLLDEYQDTGFAQIEMLVGLFADGRTVTAVGDPLQSIYSWRGASADNINRFSQRFRTSSGEPAPVYPLLTSWRNDRRILTAANRVSTPLRPAAGSSDDGDTALALGELAPRPDAGEGRVSLAFTRTVVDEAAWLADEFKKIWDSHAQWTDDRRTLAVLVRKRSGIAEIAKALRRAGLPVEVVDLGGLLTLPEVADVRAVLHVLADHQAGGSLMRLLTGARWRIGGADLIALHRRARQLAAATARSASDPAGTSDPGGTSNRVEGDVRVGGAAQVEGAVGTDEPVGTNGVDEQAERAVEDERIDPSLVEAVDDLGDPTAYSSAGYQRLRDVGGMLRELRRRMDLPLPDLVSAAESALRVDVEVAVRAGLAESRGPGSELLANADVTRAGRANLDRFVDEAARFSSRQSGVGLVAFLGYLKAAEEEEYGLKPAGIEVQSDRVQVLTIHGAKGLEWDVVAVAGLVDKSFPDAPKAHDWATTPALLPAALRGDRADLPVLHFADCADRGAAEQRVVEHRSELSARHLTEERRLAYVAFTRARQILLASGAAWGAGVNAREPSPFLVELAELGSVADLPEWYRPGDDETNPLQDEDGGSRWPVDPLGHERVAVERAATQVRDEIAKGDVLPLELTPAEMTNGEVAAPPNPNPNPERATARARAQEWTHEVDLLLAERADRRGAKGLAVLMPEHLSVSEVVALAADESALARRFRRPLPEQPTPRARRGTAFHAWLEQRWSAEALLDIDELPGAVDEQADDVELDRFKAAFEASEWASRSPVAVEVPFEMSIGGRVVRGRMDAVFADTDGGFTVVDWKTGEPPRVLADQPASVTAAHAREIQLALYRLAWAALRGIDGEHVAVRAAFHYVGANRTVRPAELLTAQQLRELIGGETTPPP